MSIMKIVTAAIAALFLLVVSAVFRFDELYIMSAAILSVPMVSYIVARVIVQRLECERDVPEYVHEGEPMEIELRLRGKSGLLGPIEIEDQLGEWIRMEGGHRSDWVFDRATITYSATARKRGHHTIGPLRLRVTDPLGFFSFTCHYPLTSRVVVFPTPLRVEHLSVRAIGSAGEYEFDGMGKKGSGIDFHGVREYQLGDDLRRVHWRSTARHRRLSVIEYEHSKAQDTLIAVDLQSGSEVGSGLYTSLEYAVRLAAGIAEETLMLGSSARLIAAGLEGPATRAGKGANQLHVILHALAGMQANQEHSLAEVLLQSSDMISGNAMVTCVVSSIDEQLLLAAEMLVSRGIGVRILSVNLTGPDDGQALNIGPIEYGVSIAAVDCSSHRVEGCIRYEQAV